MNYKTKTLLTLSIEYLFIIIGLSIFMKEATINFLGLDTIIDSKPVNTKFYSKLSVTDLRF